MNSVKPTTIVLLLICAVAIIYANSAAVDFTYDDYAFVYNNEAIRSFTPLSKFLLSSETFSQPSNDHVYRPLASFTFAINYAFNGLNPVGYHLVNLLFHLFNAFLVFLLLRRIGFEDDYSFAGALVFAIHPVHTEAVTWISGRGNVLFLFFFLISYLLYARVDFSSGDGDAISRGRTVFLTVGALAAYAFSLLAKEMALPLPALLFGHDLYFRRVGKRPQWLKRFGIYGVFVLVALAYVALRTHVLGKIGQVSYHGGSAYVTFLAMLQAAVIYARLLFIPVGLSLSRHFQPVYSLFDAAVLPSFCLVIAGILAGVVGFRRRQYFSFALLWFVVAMLPVSNIIPVNALVADRFLYGPSIGFCILLAAWVRTPAHSPQWRTTLVISGLTILSACFMVLTTARNADWKDSIALWSKATRTSPTSYVAFNNLGLEYMKRGRLGEAIEAFNKAVRIKDDFAEPHVNLGMCYAEIGDVGMAVRHYENAFAVADNNIPAGIRCRFAELLERRGRIEQAIEEYEAALRDEPDLAEAHRRLADILQTLDPARAIQHYETLARLVPDDHAVYYELARLYIAQEDFSAAENALRKNLAIDPQNASARRLLEKIEKKRTDGQNSD
jgi:Flp pilus assembly protein TadD